MKWLGELRRVVGLPELMFLAGKSLKRRGTKYTTAAILFAACALIADRVGKRFFGYDLPVTGFKAVLLPAITAAVTLGLGNVLTAVSNLFSSEKILLAEANTMNLMEDRKKADMMWHLRVMWERVFQYEARMLGDEALADEGERVQQARAHLRGMIAAWPEQVRRHFGVDADGIDAFVQHVAEFRPVTEQMETTLEGFTASAGFALKNALPQTLQRQLIGFDLALLEDWYDGAFFTANDNKLKEQFAAHGTIRRIRQEVGIRPWERLHETLAGHPDPIWFTLTMKKVGMCVGGLIDQFNRSYVPEHQPDYFNAQCFLWPDAAMDKRLEQDFGAMGAEVRERLNACRRQVVRQIFSHSRQKAHRHIGRIFARDFERALRLRLAFDVEFAAEQLEQTPLNDAMELDELDLVTTKLGKMIHHQRTLARQCLEELDVFCRQEKRPADEEPLVKRALRVTYFVHHKRFRTAQRKNTTLLKMLLDDAALEEPQTTHRLVLLRQHYELTRLQLLSYAHIVDELAGFE